QLKAAVKLGYQQPYVITDVDVSPPGTEEILEKIVSTGVSHTDAVMSDIPALSDLITSMVASGYDYRRDDDAGLWSSADLTYVITYEM
ncbi:phage tail terminator protein, partial [Klebsiella variicola]|uniref:phage tail terminator protein n=1 Tax=Klebsiella variicola TaxID=244366 RepID=UPI0039C0A759